MKVKCAISYIGDGLTKGKEYEVIKEQGVFLVVKDDDGIAKGYARSRFEKPKL